MAGQALGTATFLSGGRRCGRQRTRGSREVFDFHGELHYTSSALCRLCGFSGRRNKSTVRSGSLACTRLWLQTRPSLHAHRDPPLIHLPLVLPEKTATTMTPWLEFNINLITLMPLFQSLSQRRPATDRNKQHSARQQKRRKIADLPSGQFAHVSYVRVYANCRVRRIWLVRPWALPIGHAFQICQEATSSQAVVCRRRSNSEHLGKRSPRRMVLACSCSCRRLKPVQLASGRLCTALPYVTPHAAGHDATLYEYLC